MRGNQAVLPTPQARIDGVLCGHESLRTQMRWTSDGAAWRGGGMARRRAEARSCAHAPTRIWSVPTHRLGYGACTRTDSDMERAHARTRIWSVHTHGLGYGVCTRTHRLGYGACTRTARLLAKLLGERRPGATEGAPRCASFAPAAAKLRSCSASEDARSCSASEGRTRGGLRTRGLRGVREEGPSRTRGGAEPDARRGRAGRD
jgi:hypothetical protein